MSAVLSSSTDSALSEFTPLAERIPSAR